MLLPLLAPVFGLGAQQQRRTELSEGSFLIDVRHRVVTERSDSGKLRATHDQQTARGIFLSTVYANPECPATRGGATLRVQAKSSQPRRDSLGVTSLARIEMTSTFASNMSRECRPASRDYLRARARIEQEWTLTRTTSDSLNDGDALIIQAPAVRGDLLSLTVRNEMGERITPLRQDNYVLHFPVARGRRFNLSGTITLEGNVGENTAGSVACAGCELFQPWLGVSLATLSTAMRRTRMRSLPHRPGWTFVETVASRSVLRERIVEHARASLPCLTAGMVLRDTSQNAVCTLPQVSFVAEGIEVTTRVRPRTWDGGDTAWTTLTGVYPIRVMNGTLTLREPSRLTQSQPLQGALTEISHWMISWNPLVLQPLPEEEALRVSRMFGNGCLKPQFDEHGFPTISTAEDAVKIRLFAPVEFVPADWCRPIPPRDPAERR